MPAACIHASHCSAPRRFRLTARAIYDIIKLRRNAGEQGDLWRLASWGNGEELFRKGVVLMDEFSELLANLSALLRQLSELLDKIEYIAIKRIKK